MKFKISFGIALWILMLTLSCNRDDISFDNPSKELRFSADTVFCDTVYHQMRSETYAVKIYNQEDKDIQIPKIELEQGTSSQFRINVDGTSGTEFTNVPLRKKDSLYIFIEIAPLANTKEAIAEDHILFKLPNSTQKVTLLSVVQDAEYYIQSDNNPNIIRKNTTWTDDKAKIIFGDLQVADGITLNIERGTKVYFHKNSGLKIGKGGTLNINGDLGQEVVFRGDRNETKYDTIPVNWNAIELAENAALNMNYARIFGGNTGLFLKQAKANLRNSIIHTFMNYGIRAENSNVKATNLVLNNAGQASVGIFGGGNYDFTHSTIVNYWNINSTLPALSLYASNEMDVNGQVQSAPLNLNIANTIIYSKQADAVKFKENPAAGFNYYLQNCLLKHTNATNAGFAVSGNPKVTASLVNEDPKFVNFYTEKLNLRLKPDSPAKGRGNSTIAATVPLDLVKNSRTTAPSIGAYQ